jgi:secondary thiamine-phosphate synthase enzyme
VRQALGTQRFATRGKGLYPITPHIQAWVKEQGIADGLLTLLLQHTSASLTIQENADPDVLQDLADGFERLAPESSKLYRHNSEGPDDMPAHIRTVLSGVQLSIPVQRGRMMLGTWQGLYIFEHRRAPHTRSIALHLLGED